MSASTLSITANPTARRRPVVGGDHTKEAALLSNEAQIVSRSIQRDVFVERPVQITKSTPSLRRTPKLVPKSEKPLWLKVVSIFFKNFALLLVLIGLIQIVGKLLLKPQDYDSLVASSSAGFIGFEGRITDVESLSKKTGEMIQVLVEVVDKKINEEVEGLRREMIDMVDKKSSVLETQLEKLVGRTEVLEKSVNELKATDWLSKDEFSEFYVEFMGNKEHKNNELQGSEVSLDDIRRYARDLVEKEIEKHAADGLGMVDYALAYAGGKVVKHSVAWTGGKVGGYFVPRVHPKADLMLKPSFGEPGHCFCLKGSSGFVQIKLRTAIVPQAITLEHVAKSVAYDRSSAPKDCRITGWRQANDIRSAVDTDKISLLTEFTYDLESSNAQTFDVLDSATSGIIDMVRLEIKSNHGSQTHTCLYRIRVHGHEPTSD